MSKTDFITQSTLTEESIFTALMLTMQKKNFEEISITEITGKAGVSRMAFYRHYSSKEDIIIKHLNELFESYIQEVLACEIMDVYQFAYRYFIYFRRHQDLIMNLIKSNLASLLLERFEMYLHSIFSNILYNDSSLEINPYEIHYIAGGLYNVLIEWVKGGLSESNQKMAESISKLAGK